MELCLLCDSKSSSVSTRESADESYHNLLQLFLSYFNLTPEQLVPLKSQLGQDFPFCKRCEPIVTNLSQLQSQLTKVQNDISSALAHIASTILKLIKVNSSRGQVIEEPKQVAIHNVRKSICANYAPRVIIQDHFIHMERDAPGHKLAFWGPHSPLGLNLNDPQSGQSGIPISTEKYDRHFNDEDYDDLDYIKEEPLSPNVETSELPLELGLAVDEEIPVKDFHHVNRNTNCIGTRSSPRNTSTNCDTRISSALQNVSQKVPIVKRGRGRPKKSEYQNQVVGNLATTSSSLTSITKRTFATVSISNDQNDISSSDVPEVKRRRGRPRKGETSSLEYYYNIIDKSKESGSEKPRQDDSSSIKVPEKISQGEDKKSKNKEPRHLATPLNSNKNPVNPDDVSSSSGKKVQNDSCKDSNFGPVQAQAEKNEQKKLNSEELRTTATSLKQVPKSCSLLEESPGVFRVPNSEFRLYQTPNQEDYFTCKVCNVNIKGKDLAALHYRRFHDKTWTTVRCKNCDRCYIKKGSMDMGKHVCGPTKKPPQSRVVTEKSPKVYRIQGTDYQFYEIDGYFNCDVCGLKTKSKNWVVEHYRLLHDKTTLRCDKCSRPFMTPEALEKHTCKPVQDVRFYRRMYTDLGDGKFLYCNKWPYEKIEPDPATGREFKCGTCGNLVLDEQGIAKHIRALHMEHRYVCETCGRGYDVESAFRNHQLTHEEFRSFMCEDCGATFKTPPSLQTHRKQIHRIGLEADALKCPYPGCNRQFNSRATLKRHKRATGHRVPNLRIQEKCERCNKRLKTEKARKKHLQTCKDPVWKVEKAKCVAYGKGPKTITTPDKTAQIPVPDKTSSENVATPATTTSSTTTFTTTTTSC